MITSAEEAKKEIARNPDRGFGGCDPEGMYELGFAEGWLRCLKGKEVAALVEALEKIQKLEKKSRHEEMGCDEPCYCAVHFSTAAIAQYREAVKE